MKFAASTHSSDISPAPGLSLFTGSFHDRLEKAHSMGYDGIELMVVRPKDLDAGQVFHEARGVGLQITSIATGSVRGLEGFSLVADHPEKSRKAVQRLKELVEFASEVNAPIVTVGGFRGRLSSLEGKDARSELSRALTEAAERAAHLGVRLVIEALNRYETDFLYNAQEVLEYLESLSCANVGLLLDTFHMNIEEANIPHTVGMALKSGRLWHVHVGDNNRLPPGQGHFDFTGFLAALKEGGYEGYVTAELLPLPDADTAARQTIEYLHHCMNLV
jgi:5-keto-L-gluconate epimerase